MKKLVTNLNEKGAFNLSVRLLSFARLLFFA